MIYLDGDIQVFDNIDHLFDLPDGYFYAVMDCFCEKTWSHTPQFKIDRTCKKRFVIVRILMLMLTEVSIIYR